MGQPARRRAASRVESGSYAWDIEHLNGFRKEFYVTLSKMTDTSVVITEDSGIHALAIYFSPKNSTPSGERALQGRLLAFLEDLKDLFCGIQASDQSCEQEIKMYDAILGFCDIQSLAERCLRIFEANRSTYDGLVTKWWGLADSSPSFDRELGESVISFYESLEDYRRSAQLKSLVQHAGKMLRELPDMFERLKFLLQDSRFAKGLHECIHALQEPKRACEAFVQMATKYSDCKNVKFYYEGRPLGRSKVSRVQISPKPSLTPTSQTSSSFTLSSEPIKVAHQVIFGPCISIGRNSRSPSVTKGLNLKRQVPDLSFLLDEYGDPMVQKVAAQYLIPEEQGLGVFRLANHKRDTIVLAGSVLSTPQKKLQPKSNAFYVFGFVACYNETERQCLRDDYRRLLQASNNRIVFEKLSQAVKDDKVAFFLSEQVHSKILSSFLKTPSSRRPTVWRLVQFLGCPGSIDPPACLQRDYGFKYCKMRDEVSKLKTIYSMILKRTSSPLELHQACLSGTLFELGREKEVNIDKKDKRLMKNDHRSLVLGYDNDVALGGFQGSFYRNRLKG